MPSTKRKAPDISRQTLLSALREAGAPVRRKHLYALFGGNAALKKTIKETLNQMVQAGDVVETGKSYSLTASLPRRIGVLDVRRSGVGFVLSTDPAQKDLFIHPGNFGDAWPGDTVEAAICHLPGKDTPEGRVVRVIKRGVSELAVRAVRRKRTGAWLCQPTDSQMPFATLVDMGTIAAPQPGDILSVRPEREVEKGLWQATALRRLGAENDLSTQELLVKIGYSIAQSFPVAATAQAEKLPDAPTDADFAKRTDLRDMALVTIDGETARDFDDAVYVERQGKNFRLVVAIADVAHYVPAGSALDEEALARGNSCYFPLSVEPMFPEALSNGLCSLRPDVPRLAMVVDTMYSPQGEPGASRLYSAVIQSHARLTYTQVQASLDGQTDAPQAAMLREAAALARIFMDRRTRRGCLDLDIPEGQVRLIDGQVNVQTTVRLFSHRLIEEFMIAANERVAEYLGAQDRIFPYRVHPAPDEKKLTALHTLLTGTSLADLLPARVDRAGVQQILRAAHGAGLEHLVNRLVLRTMMQAQYSPENDGHFGLASEAYCHFTSPIRRYADLLVHRALKRALAKESEPNTSLDPVCDSLNALERKAMEAEREIQKRAAILALADRVGEEMQAVISGVAEFGFWVELLEMPVDGLVRLATLYDYYVLDTGRQELLGQRSGQRYGLGQTLSVVLEAVSLERVEINFTVPVVTAAAKVTSQYKSRQKQRSKRSPA